MEQSPISQAPGRKTSHSGKKPLQWVATLLSILFHPLLILTYMLIVLLMVNPYQFGVNSIAQQGRLLLMVFLSTFAMPAFALILMRSLHLLSSLTLEDRHERIAPYIITGIFYLWMFITFKHNPSIPIALTSATLGATIGLFGAFFFNNFTKISAHAVGMGGLTGLSATNSLFLGFDTFTLNTWLFGPLEVSTNFVLVVTIVLTGIVCTSRLLLRAHTPGQVYGGVVTGFVAQLIAYAVLHG